MKVLREEVITVDDIELLLQYKDIHNISLRLDKQGRAVVSLPLGAKGRALAFVREKMSWLRKQLAVQAEQLPVPDNGFDGEHIWLWGKLYQVDFVSTIGTEQVLLRETNQLLFTYKGTLTERKQAVLVEKFYQQCFTKMLESVLTKWQPILGLYASSWKIQRLTSKWGRCNVVTGELLFNISLVHRPLLCLEYIVLHELAHLYEPSHNERFHAFLSHYMPDWQERRALLRKFTFTMN